MVVKTGAIRVYEDENGVMLAAIKVDNHTENVRAATPLEIEAFELEQQDSEAEPGSPTAKAEVEARARSAALSTTDSAPVTRSKRSKR